MAEDEPRQGGPRDSESSPEAKGEDGDLAELARPVHVPAEIRDATFPLSVRGYSRGAVDAYVQRVNRVIAELEVRSSPRAAVRHALDRVTTQVGGILERARESSEQITTSAREEAEETKARAGAEAAQLLVDANAEAEHTQAESEELRRNAKAEAEELLSQARAEAEATLARAREEAAERLERLETELAAAQARAEARMRELQADTAAVREERRELLEDVHGMAVQLQELVSAAAARTPSEEREPSETEQEAAEVEAGAKTEVSG